MMMKTVSSLVHAAIPDHQLNEKADACRAGVDAM